MITKKEMKQALVAERKSMREKAKNSLFLRRTLSIYKAQEKRKGSELPYSVADLRLQAEGALMGDCEYCLGKLTVKTFCADHRKSIAQGGSWEMENLAFPCQSCNFQKGIMSDEEFKFLLGALDFISLESRTDVKRRLTIGGKWSFGRQA